MTLAEPLPRSVGTDALLEVRGLVVRYGPVRALNGVDVRVHPGEVVALAGENGAGKSTLVRCVAGDVNPTGGEILLDGMRVKAGRRSLARRDVAVVWQDLALCENLDVAANLLLGREEGGLMRSEARFHTSAAALLTSLGIPIHDTTQQVSSLSGGQRQLLAVARAMRDRPRLLVLDEPTAALGVIESAQVEELTRRLTAAGTTILLVSHDIAQMFRLADRIVVLRHGRVAADIVASQGHPDDVVAVMSGRAVDSTPRRQLDRLHGLVDRLASADPSSSLSLILSALGAALGADGLCLHLLERDALRLAGSVGLPDALLEEWAELPLDGRGAPVSSAATSGVPVVDDDQQARSLRPRLSAAGDQLGAPWSVPVTGTDGMLGVITVLRRGRRRPGRDELDLVTLYAGYAAGAIERDRLLGEVTARNRVLETIREVLERLAGPAPLARGLDVALAALRVGLGADEVGLVSQPPDQPVRFRAWSDHAGPVPPPSSRLIDLLPDVLADPSPSGLVSEVVEGGRRILGVCVHAPDGPVALLAGWEPRPAPGVAEHQDRVPRLLADPDSGPDAVALMGDAARSLQLALEREESERAHRETAALRRSQQLQRDFLSRLSHELRTPLTAIRGYASSLLQTDVTWDGESETRFLTRIAAESSRLGRLVDDLLDLSAIESSILRLHRDWCDLSLVLDAARACLPLEASEQVRLDYPDSLPAVWADHDRLEQVLVNLMDNAVRHNPPGTSVAVVARAVDAETVRIDVEDDGPGVADHVLAAPFDPHPSQRSATAGAGLGLSISRAIVAAHDGTLALEQPGVGTRWRIVLPVGPDPDDDTGPGAPDA